MPELIGLDFETYSAVDLKKHGLVRYVNDKSFQPLIASVAFEYSPGIARHTYPLFDNDRDSIKKLEDRIGARTIVAHNALFERVVLDSLGLHYPSSRFIDSAVIARAAGAGSHLEAAAPQLLSTNKMESGLALIKKFSIPGKYQEENDSPHFNLSIIDDYPQEWDEFVKYCELDAYLSLKIVLEYEHTITPAELEYQAITMDMNLQGWCVDLELVEEMQRRYFDNQRAALLGFQRKHGATDLNLNSLKQLKEWCAKRGIKAKSFDEKHVARLLARIQDKLVNARHTLTPDQSDNYRAVEDLLETKQILGGSSLKKLQVIVDTAAPDIWSKTNRLYDQYIHCGAGQSLRTTGRSVQMQNLKRLSVVEDMAELDDETVHWDNDKLAANLRQVFTASDPFGRLIVGDFAAVESRGLAWLAHEDWKLTEYRRGSDLYKVLASMIYGKTTDTITKAERQTGKVGELSCGYGAGPDAVVAFAEGMGVQLEQAEATKLVYDWREANPHIVQLWDRLNLMLHGAVAGNQERWELSDGIRLVLSPVVTPASLLAQHPGAQSVEMWMIGQGESIMKRYFHGCYQAGRNIRYYKPSDRKTGDLWRATFVDPKTKQTRYYELYGGKLSGILTQSFCRELFFESLLQVHRWTQGSDQVKLVGQFHDEIVLDWKPGAVALSDTKAQLARLMSRSAIAPSFPLAAEVKDDFRYTK